MPLTDVACRRAKPKPKLYKLSDMGGLQLWVHPHGSKLWRVAYRFGGKQKLLAVGKYPETTLLEAREERDKARKQLRAGQDPSHLRILEKIEQQTPADSFEVVAKEYTEKLAREGRAEITVDKIEWMLEFALPVLGPMPMRSIKPIQILAVLKSVEGRGRYETARKLRSTIGAICRYAVATARADVDPTIALKGALTVPKPKHRAAIIDSKRFGELLRAIDGFAGQGVTKQALQLMALVFPRPGELRAAKWTEFDLEKGVWSIPAERMKMRRPHRLPLPPQAVVILRDLHSVTGVSDLVVHSAWSIHKTMSENTLNGALRRLGYSQDEATSHGFRATAATLLNESGLWNPDAIERQLGHVENNDVRRAYTRGEHWDERVRMMTWWGDYLDQLRNSGQVIPLGSPKVASSR